MYSSLISTPLESEPLLLIQWDSEVVTGIRLVLDINQEKTLDNRPLPSEWEDMFHGYWQKPALETFLGLPLKPTGTLYQQRVWRALQQIPVGESRSYQQLAIEYKSGARAIASACRANPYLLAVPCHRVVAKNGIGGFMGGVTGRPIDIKRALLSHEGS